MNEKKIFIPRFVGQRSDMNYGGVVTHENYNEKLNLNMEQGDYNTEVLRILFTEKDINNAYRIPYLEKYTDDTVKDLRDTFYDLQGQINVNKENITTNKENIDILDAKYLSHNKTLTNIINGSQKVGYASVADNLRGVDKAGAHKYYGTNYDGDIGYFEVPDSIYAEDMASSSTDISGIYFTPRENSVAENMLTESVREKLNRTSIESYPELSDLPSIGGVELVGNKTLDELGIQPVGLYLTAVPDSYTNTIKNYVDTVADTKLDTTTAAATYATVAALNTVSTKCDTNYTSITNNYTRTFIGSVPTGVTPKTGDILVDL